MTDFATELAHDGWEYEEPPSDIEQALIDARATLAINPPLKPCPNKLCDAGLVVETVFYRERPPGDAVFESVYNGREFGRLIPEERLRACIRCGGRGGA